MSGVQLAVSIVNLGFLPYLLLCRQSLATILILLVIFQASHITKTSASELAVIDTFFHHQITTCSESALSQWRLSHLVGIPSTFLRKKQINSFLVKGIHTSFQRFRENVKQFTKVNKDFVVEVCDICQLNLHVRRELESIQAKPPI